MRQALVSDIHGNLEAFEAVLADIASQSIDQILCLGDIVGYGPNPCECLDTVIKRCKFSILGNHDQAALFDPDGFNPVALKAIYWTRDRLDDPGTGRASTINRRWDFLSELPRQIQEDKCLFVHGSPGIQPTNMFFPRRSTTKTKWSRCLPRCPSIVFKGTPICRVFSRPSLNLSSQPIATISFRWVGRNS